MSNYRQSTADELGIKPKITKGEQMGWIDPTGKEIPLWRPDENANHRDMVWEWLRKQKGGYVYVAEIVQNYINGYSLFTATEKAWEEYTNNK